jgi:hypothetical protein
MKVREAIPIPDHEVILVMIVLEDGVGSADAAHPLVDLHTVRAS